MFIIAITLAGAISFKRINIYLGWVKKLIYQTKNQIIKAQTNLFKLNFDFFIA
jgi:hypothetical protein